MAQLHLHTYWRSSSAYRVRIALNYKGLAYDQTFVNLLENEQRKPEYVATSPLGHVPTLTIDGTPYVESVAIIELLEELHPTPALLPKKAEDRANVRALVQVINAGTQPLQNPVVLEQLGPDKDRRVEWMKHFMARGLGAFEALVKRHEEASGAQGPFAYGDTFTMADAYLVPQVFGARRFGVDLSAFPRVVRAEKAALELPFVAAARPEVQPDAKP
ncbi:Maleylacetoacetate isomerase [Labilithrix luteola]|uniref:Maleylacetoacetate isomerase n=1 Tax=Labilithrix luteola TaxID=1391654 RepID=A0A0K1QCV7_9BACT|nr:maleylacetoacetate isomerase [Labilithrix luteola]AKV03497.1 Maleylacetoacetate isomerase [Labilithrix luteola]